MGMMEEMMDAMMGKLSKEEKLEMMSTMMEKFLAGFTVEDKQKMMEKMMPRMMEGVNMMDMMPKMMMSMMGGNGGEGGMMGMMSQMMGRGEETAMPLMPGMMMEIMMPQCIKMVLPKMTKKKRIDFAMNIVSTLVEHGSSGLSEEEKRDFVSRIIQGVGA
jgi:hypothetical protein